MRCGAWPDRMTGIIDHRAPCVSASRHDQWTTLRIPEDFEMSYPMTTDLTTTKTNLDEIWVVDRVNKIQIVIPHHIAIRLAGYLQGACREYPEGEKTI
jgi:hypothetical protein